MIWEQKGWLRVITRLLLRGRQEGQRQREAGVGDKGSRGWHAVHEDGGKGHEPRNTVAARLPPEASRRNAGSLTLWFGLLTSGPVSEHTCVILNRS